STKSRLNGARHLGRKTYCCQNRQKGRHHQNDGHARKSERSHREPPVSAIMSATDIVAANTMSAQVGIASQRGGVCFNSRSATFRSDRRSASRRSRASFLGPARVS